MNLARAETQTTWPPLDLPQVDFMNFRVEYVRPRSGVEDVRLQGGRF